MDGGSGRAAMAKEMAKRGGRTGNGVGKGLPWRRAPAWYFAVVKFSAAAWCPNDQPAGQVKALRLRAPRMAIVAAKVEII